MDSANGIFDISTPLDFFSSIEQSFKKYKTEKTKSIELLLYVIMGLNHLREWIAPGYNYEDPPANDAEEFYRLIYSESSYKTINALCNRTKHLNTRDINTSSSYGIPFDKWSNFDSVRNIDKGPVTNYFVDDINITEIINDVIDFYKKEWFKKKNLIP